MKVEQKEDKIIGEITKTEFLCKGEKSLVVINLHTQFLIGNFKW